MITVKLCWPFNTVSKLKICRNNLISPLWSNKFERRLAQLPLVIKIDKNISKANALIAFLCSYFNSRGGTPLYKVYRFVPPQRVWFLSRFGLKTGIDFDNYGLKSGRVLGAGNIYESLQIYFTSQYVTGTTN